MAQLRDAHTSDIIATGTPLELALIADKIGGAEVLFDDVGAAFDPAAVIEAAKANADGLAAALKAAKADDKPTLEKAAQAASAELEVATADTDATSRRLDAARQRRTDAEGT